MLTYLAIARRYRPSWVLWENVPGVLTSGNGRDFGTFLTGLGQCGYGFAYRVLDAQYVRVDGLEFAVPQRRRRVFVVGYLGDWRRAAAVLFDRESLSGHHPPRRRAGQAIAAIPAGSPAIGDRQGVIAADVAPTLNAAFGQKMGLENQHIDGGAGLFVESPVKTVHQGDTLVTSEMAWPPLSAQGGNNGGGGGAILVGPIAFQATASPDYLKPQYDLAPTLKAGGKTGTGAPTAIAIQEGAERVNPTSGPEGAGFQSDLAYTLEARHRPQSVVTSWAVRRLTPLECERLQGFPDGWTDVPVGNRQAAESPRYKAIGNSMAVNVMRWIGRRIAMVDDRWPPC